MNPPKPKRSMKLNEIFPYDSITNLNGIFAMFKAIYPSEFELFFGDVDTVALDTWFISTYGERPASNFVCLMQEGKISWQAGFMVIFSMHMLSWKKSQEALYTELGPFDNYTLKETRVGVTERDSTLARENIETEPLYNEPSPVVTLHNRTNETNGSKTTDDYTIIKTGNIGNTVNSDLINRQIWTYRTKLAQLIFSDLRDYMTLQIYE